jgi:hypothetical protein
VPPELQLRGSRSHQAEIADPLTARGIHLAFYIRDFSLQEDGMSAMNSLISAAAGAGLMYVLDPVSGVRRRALARDQVEHARRQLMDETGTVLRDARHRVRGSWMALVSQLASGDVPDDVLEDRIRARLGLLVRYPRLVQVDCENGNVVLTGMVASDELGRLVRRIRTMSGVSHVDNRLEHRGAADLPGAQAPVPPRPPAPRLDLMRRRWSPSVRMGGVAVGGGLLLDGVRRGRFAGAALGIAGILILFRALTNEPVADGCAPRLRRDSRGGQPTGRPRGSEPAALAW